MEKCEYLQLGKLFSQLRMIIACRVNWGSSVVILCRRQLFAFVALLQLLCQKDFGIYKSFFRGRIPISGCIALTEQGKFLFSFILSLTCEWRYFFFVLGVMFFFWKVCSITCVYSDNRVRVRTIRGFKIHLIAIDIISSEPDRFFFSIDHCVY